MIYTKEIIVKKKLSHKELGYMLTVNHVYNDECTMDEEKNYLKFFHESALNKFGKVLVNCPSRDVMDVKLDIHLKPNIPV